MIILVALNFVWNLVTAPINYVIKHPIPAPVASRVVITKNTTLYSLDRCYTLNIKPSSYLKSIYIPSVETNRIVMNAFQQSAWANYFQSITLIYLDIYECTKPYQYAGWGRDDSGKSVYKMDIGYDAENNKVAAWFWKQNMWVAGLMLANAANLSVVSLLNSVDSSGVSAWAYTVTVNVAEVLAIQGWFRDVPNLKTTAPVYTTLFTYTF
jgi:hypothetical protein